MSKIGLQISGKRSKSSFKINNAISVCKSLYEGTNDKNDPKEDTLSSPDNFDSQIFITCRIFPSQQLAKELITT